MNFSIPKTDIKTTEKIDIIIIKVTDLNLLYPGK